MVGLKKSGQTSRLVFRYLFCVCAPLGALENKSSLAIKVVGLLSPTSPSPSAVPEHLMSMTYLWFRKGRILESLSFIIFRIDRFSLLLTIPLFVFVQTSVPVNMQIDIAPQHHLFIIGRNGINIKQIMQRTGAK